MNILQKTTAEWWGQPHPYKAEGRRYKQKCRMEKFMQVLQTQIHKAVNGKLQYKVGYRNGGYAYLEIGGRTGTKIRYYITRKVLWEFNGKKLETVYTGTTLERLTQAIKAWKGE